MAFRRNNNHRRRTNQRRPQRPPIPGPRRQANVTVVPRKNEPIEKVIKRFIRKVKKEGIIEEIRDRRYYKKPSEARREKRAKALREAERIRKKTERKKETQRKRQDKLRRMRAKGGNTSGSTR
jgi:small subunit ribosomal protein S21